MDLAEMEEIWKRLFTLFTLSPLLSAASPQPPRAVPALLASPLRSHLECPLQQSCCLSQLSLSHTH